MALLRLLVNNYPHLNSSGIVLVHEIRSHNFIIAILNTKISSLPLITPCSLDQYQHWALKYPFRWQKFCRIWVLYSTDAWFLVWIRRLGSMRPWFLLQWLKIAVKCQWQCLHYNQPMFSLQSASFNLLGVQSEYYMVLLKFHQSCTSALCCLSAMLMCLSSMFPSFSFR